MTFLTVRLLEVDRPYRHPWLSPSLAAQEMARQDFEADPIEVFEQSLRVEDTTVAVSEVDGVYEISDPSDI